MSPGSNLVGKQLTLKQLIQQKHKATWGDVPLLFQQIASSAADIDGLFKQGFDHALKQILNRRNWNSQLLTDPATRQLKKPRLAIYQLFTDWGFEVHCFPYLHDQEIDEYQRLNPAMEFALWDPGTMRRLIHIRHLQEFIDFAHHTGDPIDKALLTFTNAAVNKVMRYLDQEVTITKVAGVSIPQYVKLSVEKQGDYQLNNLPPHVLKRLGSETFYLLRQAEKRHTERLKAEANDAAAAERGANETIADEPPAAEDKSPPA